MRAVLTIVAIALAGLAGQAYAASATTSVASTGIAVAPTRDGAAAPLKVAPCPRGCWGWLEEEERPST
jgi:hypothetical protein